MVFVHGNMHRKEAEELALVMASADIECMILKEAGRYGLQVEAGKFDQAVAAISSYRRENAMAVRKKPLPTLEKSWSGIFVALLLLVVFLKTGPLDSSDKTVKFFAASASRISSAGEIYRCVTALFLHAGWPHLMGNMAGLAIFATGVMQVSGDGLGWFMVLVSAALANWINALIFAVMGQISFGASTAVFAAAGILSGYSTVHRFKAGEVILKALIPLGAGTAILSFAGTGPGSDISGHMLGFVVGTVTGSLFGLLGRKPSEGGQMILLAFSVALCSIAFLIGA